MFLITKREYLNRYQNWWTGPLNQHQQHVNMKSVSASSVTQPGTWTPKHTRKGCSMWHCVYWNFLCAKGRKKEKSLHAVAPAVLRNGFILLVWGWKQHQNVATVSADSVLKSTLRNRPLTFCFTAVIWSCCFKNKNVHEHGPTPTDIWSLQYTFAVFHITWYCINSLIQIHVY